MSSCDMIREMLVLHAEGILEPEESRQVDAHLAGCANCAAESVQIRRIRGWLAGPELFVPTQDVTWQLLPEKLAVRVKAQPRKWSYLGLRFPKWAWCAVALVVFAAGLTWTRRVQAPAPAEQPPLAAVGNEAFLGRVRTAYAREATSQYLTGCQKLLLDLTGADRKCAGDRYDVSLEVTQARQLLQEKRMLDAQLSVPDVAHARSLCDELESFLVSLSTSQDCETRDTLRSMERSIERDQLMLRINLVQSGISLE
jgi:predicted anti-sigma-YlaC factor YlaD